VFWPGYSTEGKREGQAKKRERKRRGGCSCAGALHSAPLRPVRIWVLPAHTPRSPSKKPEMRSIEDACHATRQPNTTRTRPPPISRRYRVSGSFLPQERCQPRANRNCGPDGASSCPAAGSDGGCPPPAARARGRGVAAVDDRKAAQKEFVRELEEKRRVAARLVVGIAFTVRSGPSLTEARVWTSRSASAGIRPSRGDR
jgi:hypothetical protein